MSEVTPLPVRPALARTVRGFALCAAFGGFGACGTENTDAGPMSTRVTQASTDIESTQVNGQSDTESTQVNGQSDAESAQVNGQSGTEYGSGGGADHPSCPCGWLTNPLRGTVLDVVHHIEGANFRPLRLGTVRLRVDELLGSTTGLEIGSEISSPWFGELPCFFGCASIEVGDEVLAFYRFPEPCIDTTGDDCPFGDTIPGNIALTPWSDAPVLARLSGGNLTLAVEDIPLLESPECDAQIGNWGDLLGPNENGPRCYELEQRAP